ncbi:hypothetical protein MHAE_06944 [Mycobacterium haemophilum DSM 44634]
MFARVFGPFFVIVPVIIVVRAPDMRTLLSDFGANPLWPWVTGAFLLMGGLIVIALHQYWRSAAAVIVSLLGWVLALRGFFLLAFPKTFMSMANSAIDATAVWAAVYIGLALIGLYLTYVGWVAARRGPTSQATSSKPDLPRAA